MSARGWDRFVSSLLTPNQAVGVELGITNIDDSMVRMILASPYFEVARDDGERDGKGRYKRLGFTTVPTYKKEEEDDDYDDKSGGGDYDDDDDEGEEKK